jgi:polysaccharide export outer membrane protein
VLRDPRENLRLRGGDTLLVTHRSESFTVFGATGRSAQIEFGAAQLTLAEAVAKSGGLTDSRADPRGVFLFRYEPEAVAGQLGVSGVVRGDTAPVVYQFDFLSASSYFLSQKFMLKNQDVLYVANAPASELEKFLQLVGLLSQPVISGVVVGNTVK